MEKTTRRRLTLAAALAVVLSMVTYICLLKWDIHQLQRDFSQQEKWFERNIRRLARRVAESDWASGRATYWLIGANATRARQAFDAKFARLGVRSSLADASSGPALAGYMDEYHFMDEYNAAILEFLRRERGRAAVDEFFSSHAIPVRE
jgi:hypothetical protein